MRFAYKDPSHTSYQLSKSRIPRIEDIAVESSDIEVAQKVKNAVTIILGSFKSDNRSFATSSKLENMAQNSKHR